MPRNTDGNSYEWAFVTTLLKNQQWAEGEPGVACQPGDKCRCNFCGKQFFMGQIARVRAHVAGVKGYDVTACTGPAKRDDETLLAYQGRKDQFMQAKERCKATIDEKEAYVGFTGVYRVHMAHQGNPK